MKAEYFQHFSRFAIGLGLDVNIGKNLFIESWISSKFLFNNKKWLELSKRPNLLVDNVTKKKKK